MMQKNTVCLLNDSFPPQIDGVSNAILNYAKYAHYNGYDPIVVTPAHPRAADEQFPFPVVRYPSVTFRKMDGYMAGIPFSPETARSVAGQTVSLIHTHCPIMSTFMARELRQITDAPIVLTYHTKFDVDIANIVKHQHLQSACKKALVANISACDEVWAVSQGAGENLRSLGYEGDYIVMPNGVDLPRERIDERKIANLADSYDLPTGIPIYLFVGRMMWYKGIRIILDALCGLHQQEKDFRMVFIGDGDDRAEIESYAENCGIKQKCVFAGTIHDREVLRAWYCRADLFLFPSSYDTNGLVVREAAACGLASVLIENSCAAEGVTDGRNGFLISESADSLCRRLAGLHGDFNVTRTVGKFASKELYISWESAVQTAMDRYAVVIERYKSGYYPRRIRPMEGFMKLNGELMEGLAYLSSKRRMKE